MKGSRNFAEGDNVQEKTMLCWGTEGFKNLQRIHFLLVGEVCTLQMTDLTGRPGRQKIYFCCRWRHW